MMQAAHFGERNGLSLFGPLDGSRFGWVFLQSQVSPASVILREVGFEHALQVSLVEDDDVVGEDRPVAQATFSPGGDRILLRRQEGKVSPYAADSGEYPKYGRPVL